MTINWIKVDKSLQLRTLSTVSVCQTSYQRTAGLIAYHCHHNYYVYYVQIVKINSIQNASKKARKRQECCTLRLSVFRLSSCWCYSRRLHKQIITGRLFNCWRTRCWLRGWPRRVNYDITVFWTCVARSCHTQTNVHTNACRLQSAKDRQTDDGTAHSTIVSIATYVPNEESTRKPS